MNSQPNKLNKKSLNLDIPTSPEDAEYKQMVDKSMKIFSEISDVFVENKITLEEALVILTSMAQAVEFYVVAGKDIGEVII